MERFCRALFECADLCGEAALVAVGFVFVDAVCFRGLVENLGNFGQQRLRFVFLAASDCCADGFEFGFDRHLYDAVACGAFDRLTCAFGG